MWRYLADSVVGTSHERAGSPCQDSNRITTYAVDGDTYLIVACSDGAGSATHADVGSKLACEVVIERVCVFLDTRQPLAEADRNVAVEWFSRVRDRLTAEAESRGVEPRQLSCTLILAVLGAAQSLFVQIGDGAVVTVDADAAAAKPRPVFWPQNGEYANTTYFVTDAVPPDPTPVLLNVPELTAETPRDFLAGPRNRRDALRRFAEYRTAKWGSVVAALLAMLLHHNQMPFAALSVLLLGSGGLGCVWLILWVRVRREFRRMMRVAMVEQEREDGRVREARRIHEGRRAEVDKENHRRLMARRQQAADLQRLRDQLPRANAEKRQRWEAERIRIEQATAAAHERNRVRLQDWQARAAAFERARRREWEQEVAAVQASRELIKAENQRRREQWDRLLPQHHARVRAINELNTRRLDARKAYGRESNEREAARALAEATLQQVLLRWGEQRSIFEQRILQVLGDLERSRQTYADLKSAFDSERNQGKSNARKTQLDDYLRQQLIATASIPGIAKGRKGPVFAFGIETAYDINVRQLSALRGEGFGPRLIDGLYFWRAGCESRFVFDARKQAASPALRNLHAKYRAPRTTVQNALRMGVPTAKSTFSAATEEVQNLLVEANRAASVFAQCQSDLRLAEHYAGS